MRVAMELIDSAQVYLEEFQNSKCASKTPSLTLRTPSFSWWICPSNRLKLNTDVAVRSGVLGFGYGGVTRDSLGSVLACRSFFLSGYDDIESCELLTLKEGI
ncbi:hypothetical protein TorRG33x02_048600 [Trema orientale]|uniref:Uncharacterized protein n=1 Tax=Trema orientale TaxID=63057 RepID=A0A2P5FNC2_TREOI|nr:hypothetical protein TorRG33x02_048600 [Trema orientale]